MDLHVNYEKAPQYSFTRVDIKPEKIPAKKTGAKPAEKASRFAYVPDPKPKLKADKSAGTIELDDVTLLKGIPPEAWEYKLGNRSALEWVLDQYKEKKPTDPTIAEKFNTYRFVDYKERVIELLKRVTSVSVRTMEITGKMKDAVR
jgi:predicted helicase